MERTAMAKNSKAKIEANRRYSEQNYVQVQAKLPKDIGYRFRDVCKEKRVSQRQVLLDAVTKFLEENE